MANQAAALFAFSAKDCWSSEVSVIFRHGKDSLTFRLVNLILGRDGHTAAVLNDFGCQIDWAGAAAGRVRLHVRGLTVAGREWVRAESNAARGSNRRQLNVSFVPCLDHLLQLIVAATHHDGTKNLSVQNTKDF